MVCQDCGIDAPTKRVTFVAIVGFIVAFWWSTSAGHFCKSCIHRHFWELTLRTVVGGWWGVLSMVATPLILLSNTAQYVHCCVTLKAVPPGATRPQLTPEAIRRLRPFAQSIAANLKNGVKAVVIASRLGPVADVTPAQVMLFIWTKEHERQMRIAAGYEIELPN
jgi:hypothetical protein